MAGGHFLRFGATGDKPLGGGNHSPLGRRGLKQKHIEVTVKTRLAK